MKLSIHKVMIKCDILYNVKCCYIINISKSNSIAKLVFMMALLFTSQKKKEAAS